MRARSSFPRSERQKAMTLNVFLDHGSLGISSSIDLTALESIENNHTITVYNIWMYLYEQGLILDGNNTISYHRYDTEE